MDSTQKQDFHFFPQLPTELRLAIWRYCLPTRVVELDTPWDDGAYSILIPPPCSLRKTTTLNRHPPVLSRVCRESRLVASEIRHSHISKPPPPNANWTSGLKLNTSWIDPSRDTVHLNWTPCYESQYQSDGSALDYLAWNSVQVRGGSFMFDYVDNTFDGDVDMEERIGAVQQLRNGATIVMRIIIVHTSFEHAARTGLFGHLGDVPIQVVDISDEARLDALFDFAHECERNAKGFIKTRQDFHRASPKLVKTTLKEKLDETFGVEAAQTLSHICPAIMFRFCPHYCNHSLGASQRARDIANRRKPQSKLRQDVRSFADSFHMR